MCGDIRGTSWEKSNHTAGSPRKEWTHNEQLNCITEGGGGQGGGGGEGERRDGEGGEVLRFNQLVVTAFVKSLLEAV